MGRLQDAVVAFDLITRLLFISMIAPFYINDSLHI